MRSRVAGGSRLSARPALIASRTFRVQFAGMYLKRKSLPLLLKKMLNPNCHLFRATFCRDHRAP